MKKNLLSIIVLVGFVFSANIFSQEVGDYGSNGSANWNVVANWIICQTGGTWDDATAAGGVPGQTNNIWIRNGHTVTVEASGKTFKNLTIENGAKLVGANTLPTTSLRYIRIYGASLTNNGTIGSSTDCLGLSLYGGNGQVVTVTGSGTTNFSRIQQNSTGTSIIFDADISLNYAGGTGTGSTALYVSTSGNTFGVTINAGKTLTMAPYAYISGTTSSGSSAATSTLTIDILGTIVTQTNSIINLNVNSPHFSTITVRNGGSINLGSFLRTNTGSGTMTINVENGGTINGQSGSSFDMASSTTQINGTVNLGLSSTSTRSLGTATIGSTGKLRFRDGTYPTGAITLNSGSTVEYYGSEAITLGTSPDTYHNLTINNSAGVTLGTNITVNGTLLKENGDITLGDYTINFGPSSSTGAVQALNAPSSVNVGDLGAVISSGANLGSTTVTRGLYALAGNSNQGIKRWYKITPTNNTGLSATLVFPYNEGDELNGITEGNLRLFKSTDDGATWTMVTTGGDITVTHDPDNNTFTVTGLDGFSLWTLGDNSNPLPVELTSFNAKATGKNVILNWATATEIDNYGFEIERTHHNPPFEKAGTQGGWEKLGFVQGSGNSNSVKEYSFTDKSSKKNGTFVYRLKQIDNNGTFQYSNEVEVEVNIPLSYAVSQNYPNPFNPSTRIEYQIPLAGKVSIKLYDVLGNLVTSLVDETKEAGSYIFDFDARNLSNGVYFYQIRAGEFIQTKKMTLIK